VVRFNNRKGQINPGSGDHRAVADVDFVADYRDARVLFGEFCRIGPVSSGPATVEQADVGEQERTRAYRRDAFRGTCDCFHEWLVGQRVTKPDSSGHQQSVETAPVCQQIDVDTKPKARLSTHVVAANDR